jgi:hypothetical protein
MGRSSIEVSEIRQRLGGLAQERFIAAREITVGKLAHTLGFSAVLPESRGLRSISDSLCTIKTFLNIAA